MLNKTDIEALSEDFVPKRARPAQTRTSGYDYLVSVSYADGTSESYTYCGEGIRRTKTGADGFRRFIVKERGLC